MFPAHREGQSVGRHSPGLDQLPRPWGAQIRTPTFLPLPPSRMAGRDTEQDRAGRAFEEGGARHVCQLHRCQQFQFLACPLMPGFPSCLMVTGEIIGSLSWTHQWSRKWQPTQAFLPGKFHGQRSLEGYRPWGHKEWDTTEHTPVQKRPEASLGESRQGFQLCRNNMSVSDKEFKSPIYKNYGVTWYLTSRELTSDFPFLATLYLKKEGKEGKKKKRTEIGKYCFQ